MKVALRRFVFTLGQMATAVWALLLLAVASTAGTFIPQNVPFKELELKYGSFWAEVFQFLRLDTLYSAWWFLAIAGFLVASVSVCLVQNGPRLWRQLKAGKAFPTKAQLKTKPLFVALPQTEIIVQGILKKDGFKCQKIYPNGASYWLKGRLGRVGYFLAHGGVVLLSIGALLTGVFGYRLSLQLIEGEEYAYAARWTGEAFSVQDLDFTISAAKVSVPRYFTGMPKQFVTELSLKEEGQTLKQVQLQVNHPVAFAGHRIYQADYGDGGSFVAIGLRNVHAGGALLTGPFEGRTAFNETIFSQNGTVLTPLKLQPATVLSGGVEGVTQKHPQDIGPSVEILLASPSEGKKVLRLFLNMPWVIGVEMAPEAGNSVRETLGAGFEMVFLGLNPLEEEGWPLVQALLRALPPPGVLSSEEAQAALFTALKTHGRPFLVHLPEEKRLKLGLLALTAANAVYALGLEKLPVLKAAKFKPYAGVILARDPGAFWFILGGVLLALGVGLMLMQPFIRLWLQVDGKNATLLGAYSSKSNVLIALKTHLVDGVKDERI